MGPADEGVNNQDDGGVLLDLSAIPLEVLELILSQLTDPVSQRRLAQVIIGSGDLWNHLNISHFSQCNHILSNCIFSGSPSVILTDLVDLKVSFYNSSQTT